MNTNHSFEYLSQHIDYLLVQLSYLKSKICLKNLKFDPNSIIILQFQLKTFKNLKFMLKFQIQPWKWTQPTFKLETYFLQYLKMIKWNWQSGYE